jgi:hypothetical protein
VARLASRRAHAVGLGGRALSKPLSSVTRSQPVKAVRSEGRFRYNTRSPFPLVWAATYSWGIHMYIF